MLPNVPRAGRPKALPDVPIGVALNHWVLVSGPDGSPIRSTRFGPVSRSAPGVAVA